MKLDGVSLMALIAIVAFAIDRLATGVLFVLSLKWKFLDPATVIQAQINRSAENEKKAVKQTEPDGPAEKRKTDGPSKDDDLAKGASAREDEPSKEAKLAEEAEFVNKRYKFAYFGTAGILTILALCSYDELRVLQILDIENANLGRGFRFLDFVVTAVALVGGAERIAALIDKYGKSPETAPEPAQPITITGTVTLAEKPAQENKEGEKQTP